MGFPDQQKSWPVPLSCTYVSAQVLRTNVFITFKLKINRNYESDIVYEQKVITSQT